MKGEQTTDWLHQSWAEGRARATWHQHVSTSAKPRLISGLGPILGRYHPQVGEAPWPNACVSHRNKGASVWPASGLCDSSAVSVMTRAQLGPHLAAPRPTEIPAGGTPPPHVTEALTFPLGR